MKKVFHLKTCSTCIRIIKEINWPKDIEFQNIKELNISSKELSEIISMGYTNTDLFSKRAMKYKSLGLKDMKLEDKDLRKYILEEYTFLKRPVVVYNNSVFIGNSKKNVLEMKDFFDSL